MVCDAKKRVAWLLKVKGRSNYFFKYTLEFANKMIAAIGRLARLLANDPDSKFTWGDAAELQLKVMASQMLDKSNTELLDALAEAVYDGDQFVVVVAREAISLRIARGDWELTDSDKKLIDQAITLLSEIEKADLDLPHQSDRLRRAGAEYVIIRECLLERMRRK